MKTLRVPVSFDRHTGHYATHPIPELPQRFTALSLTFLRKKVRASSLEVEVLAVQALNLSSSALRSACASVSCDRPSFFLVGSGTLSRVAGLLFWEKGIGFRKKTC
jgi:hypothetical protein